MRWLMLIAILFCSMIAPPVFADECSDALSMIKDYSEWQAETFAALLAKENEVNDLADKYNSAVARRDRIVRTIKLITDYIKTNPVTDPLLELLNDLEGRQLPQAKQDVTDAKAALDKANAEVDVLKNRLTIVTKLRNEKEVWYNEHCGDIPEVPDPVPTIDPLFP